MIVCILDNQVFKYCWNSWIKILNFHGLKIKAFKIKREIHKFV